jgi:hypothetical protein
MFIKGLEKVVLDGVDCAKKQIQTKHNFKKVKVENYLIFSALLM